MDRAVVIYSLLLVALTWAFYKLVLALEPRSAFNTAVSFATNTNWQGYGGEST